MSSTLRPFVALFGLALAAPLAAQTAAMHSTTAVATVTPSTPAADTAVTWVELRSKQGELRGKLPQLLKAEIAKAVALGKTPFLEVGATWCGPCQELEAKLHDKDMIDAFSGAYMIHLDVNEWDTESDMGPLGFTGGTIPIIASIDKNGMITNEAHGLTTAAPIKTYLHAHFWKPMAVSKAAMN